MKQLGIPVCIAVGFVSLSGCALWERNHDSQPWGTQHRTTMTDQELRRLVASARPFIRNPQMHFRQGLYFQTRGQHKLAVDEFAKVLLLEPDHIKALNAMAVSCDKLEDYEQAVALYKQALSLDPDQDYIYNNLGYSYFLQGNYTAAVQAFHRAVALDESNKIFLNNLGMAYAQKGLFDEALAEFQRDTHVESDALVSTKPAEQIATAPKAAVPSPTREPIQVAKDHTQHLPSPAEPIPLINIQTGIEQTETAQTEPEPRHWIRKPIPQQPGKETNPTPPEQKDLDEPIKTFEPEHPQEFERPIRPDQFKKPREIVVVADSRSPNPVPPAEQPLPEPAGTPSSSDHHTEPQTDRPTNHQPESRIESQVEPQVVTQDDSLIEQQAQPQPAHRIEQQVVAQSKSRPEPQAEPQVEYQVEPQTLHRNEHQPEIRTELQVQTITATPVAPAAELQSSTQPTSSSVPFVPHRPANQHDFLKAVPVEVLNGNGISRMAHQVGSYLEENGFRVIRTKNADHFDHHRTIIHYGIGYLPAAELLSRQFPGEYLLKEEASLDRFESRIRVVVGKDLDQHKMAVLQRRQDEDATHHATYDQGTMISRGPDSPVRP